MNDKEKESETYVEKVLTIENEKTKIVHQFRVKILYKPSTREINLSRAICQIHSQGLHIENSHIFYQDIQRRCYMFLGTYPFSSEIYVQLQVFPEPVIKLKYRKLSHLDPPKTSPKQPAIQPRPKLKQRTIEEVIKNVRRWRELLAMTDAQGRKIHTRESAAEIIGINKKTLQDYAYQVNLGEMYGFNFEQNKQEKIGILRKFIKKKKKQIAYINNTDNYWFTPPSSEEESHN